MMVPDQSASVVGEQTPLGLQGWGARPDAAARAASYGRTVSDTIGADTVTLDHASARFTERADLLATVGPALAGLFSTTAWAGADAGAFESDLHGSIIPRLEHISAQLRAAASALTTNAAEQREASGAIDTRGSCPAPFLPPRSQPAPEPSLPEDRPMSSQYVGIEGEVGVGPAQVRVDGNYLIEYLANGEIRITEVLGAAGGVGADTPGARVEIDMGELELTSGAMAGASALAGLQLGRTWEIPDDELDNLLVRLGVQKFGVPEYLVDGVDAGTGFLEFISPDALSPWDEINDFVDNYINYEVPDPTRTGLDITGSAEAYAVLGLGPTGSAEASAELGIAVGAFRESDGDIGVRYAIDGSLSGDTHMPIGELAGLFDPPSGSLEGSQAVELVFGDGAQPSEIVIEQTYGTGENQTQQTVRVDLDSDQLRADALTIQEAITNPTPANLAALADLDITEWAEGVEYTEASLRVSGEDYGVSAGASAIPGIFEGSASISVEHQAVDYDYQGDDD